MKSGAVSGHMVITNVWCSFSPEPSFSPSAFLNVGRERRVRMSKRQTFWHMQVKGLCHCLMETQSQCGIY